MCREEKPWAKLHGWGGFQEDGVRPYTVVYGRRTKDNRLEKKEKSFAWYIRRSYFTLRTTKRWNRVDTVLGDLHALRVSRPYWVKLLSWVWPQSWPCFATRDLRRSLPTWVIWFYCTKQFLKLKVFRPKILAFIFGLYCHLNMYADVDRTWYCVDAQR